MKKIQFAAFTFLIAMTAYSQQWTGSTNSSGLISRNGNVSMANGNALISDVGYDRAALDLFDQDDSEYLRLYSSGSDGYLRIQGTNPGAIRFFPGNSEKVHFAANGNVGIGTSSPSGSISSNQTGLHILDDNVSYLSLESTAGSGKKYTMYSSTTGSLVFWDASSSLLRGTIDANGNWGIGTATPSAELEIKASSPSLKLSTLDPNNSYQLNMTANYDYNNRFTFDYGGAVFLQEKKINNVGGTPSSKIFLSNYYGIGLSTNTTNPTSESQIDLYISGNGAPNGSGNVGIGTTDPTAKLHVLQSPSGLSPTNVTGLFVENSGNSNSWYVFQTATIGGGKSFSITNAGNVGIGTTTPSQKLEVNGTIRSKEVKVEANGWPDYVFEPSYDLRTLKETKKYISKHKHLPEIPSASEISENGVDLGDMNMRLLKKIEELTLHQIELMEEMEAMKKELEKLKK